MTAPIMKKAPSSQKKGVAKDAFLGIFFLAASFIIFRHIWHQWLAPQQGTFMVGSAPSTVTPFDSSLETKVFQGRVLTFTYPSFFKLYDRSEENTPVKESIYLVSSAPSGEKIAITVEQREEAKLSASPSFQLRQGKKDTYQQESKSVAGRVGVLFTQLIGSPEKTFFFLENGLIVSVAVTSFDKDGNLEEWIEKTLEDVKFSER